MSPIITPSGAGGGGSGIGAVLFDSTLGADTVSIDTGATLPATYHLLEVYIIARTDDAAASATLSLNVNGDFGAVYDLENVTGNSGTASAGNSLGATKWDVDAHGSGGTAGYASSACLLLPGYAETVFFKTGHMLYAVNDATAGNNFVRTCAVGYRSTNAISQVRIAAQGAAKLKTGSRLLIFGR